MLFLSRQHNSPPSIMSLFPRKRRGRRGEHSLRIKFQNCHQRSSHFSHLCLFMFSFFLPNTSSKSILSPRAAFSAPRGFQPIKKQPALPFFPPQQ